MNLREAVISAWGMGQAGMLMIAELRESSGPIGRVKNLGLMCWYGFQCGRMCSNKRMRRMDVDGLVKKWIEAVVGMTLAHTKDEFDREDAKADELLGPILTAPIAQVRDFYNKFRSAMESDPRVPFIVRMGFDAWGDVVVNHATDDEKIIRLKNKLASEIAELVELPIRDQIPKAIERALRWRDPETLEKVKEVLEAGKKPKLVGRQSCLFLELGHGKNKTSVML